MMSFVNQQAAEKQKAIVILNEACPELAEGSRPQEQDAVKDLIHVCSLAWSIQRCRSFGHLPGWCNRKTFLRMTCAD
jgi:hypothetical protein